MRMSNNAKKVGLNVTDKQRTLPIMYWLPKMHKTPTSFRFIVASKHCSTKPLTNVISRVFKLIFAQVESFHKKAIFIISLINFGLFKILFLPLIKLIK